MEFWARRTMSKSGMIVLAPADEISAERAAKMPSGKLLRVEAVAPRNPQFHRLTFALFGLIARNFDVPLDAVREELLIKIGHSYAVKFPGYEKEYAKSISYAEMDDIAFKELFEKLVKATYLIFGILSADIRREIDNILAPDRRG